MGKTTPVEPGIVETTKFDRQIDIYVYAVSPSFGTTSLIANYEEGHPPIAAFAFRLP
jgi:hypothetical protein